MCKLVYFTTICPRCFDPSIVRDIEGVPLNPLGHNYETILCPFAFESKQVCDIATACARDDGTNLPYSHFNKLGNEFCTLCQPYHGNIGTNAIPTSHGVQGSSGLGSGSKNSGSIEYLTLDNVMSNYAPGAIKAPGPSKMMVLRSDDRFELLDESKVEPPTQIGQRGYTLENNVQIGGKQYPKFEVFPFFTSTLKGKSPQVSSEYTVGSQPRILLRELTALAGDPEAKKKDKEEVERFLDQLNAAYAKGSSEGNPPAVAASKEASVSSAKKGKKKPVKTSAATPLARPSQPVVSCVENQVQPTLDLGPRTHGMFSCETVETSTGIETICRRAKPGVSRAETRAQPAVDLGSRINGKGSGPCQKVASLPVPKADARPKPGMTYTVTLPPASDADDGPCRKYASVILSNPVPTVKPLAEPVAKTETSKKTPGKEKAAPKIKAVKGDVRVAKTKTASPKKDKKGAKVGKAGGKEKKEQKGEDESVRKTRAWRKEHE